jgi:hypothetical protein
MSDEDWKVNTEHKLDKADEDLTQLTHDFRELKESHTKELAALKKEITELKALFGTVADALAFVEKTYTFAHEIQAVPGMRANHNELVKRIMQIRERSQSAL